MWSPCDLLNAAVKNIQKNVDWTCRFNKMGGKKGGKWSLFDHLDTSLNQFLNSEEQNDGSATEVLLRWWWWSQFYWSEMMFCITDTVLDLRCVIWVTNLLPCKLCLKFASVFDLIRKTITKVNAWGHEDCASTSTVIWLLLHEVQGIDVIAMAMESGIFPQHLEKHLVFCFFLWTCAS